MRLGISRYRTRHTIIMLTGTVPFIIWSFQTRSIWPEFFLAVYLLSGVFVFSVLIGYPGSGNSWFWIPFLIFSALHCVILGVFTLGALAIVLTGVRPPTAMLFGFLLTAMGIEALIWTRLMQRFLLKHGRSKKKNHTSRLQHG
jgi:hypothetical protein